MAVTPYSSDNVLLGRGEVFFDQFSTGTTRTGELHLGNVKSFEMNVEEEKKELQSSMAGFSTTYKSVTVKRSWKGKLSGTDFPKENLALLNLGSLSTITQTGSTVTDEQVTASAVLGRYYPTTKRSISAVTVKAGAAGSETSKTVTTDYTVDATTGRIYIVPGGGISAGDSVLVSYTYATVTLPVVNGSTQATIEGYLRFVGNPACGPVKEVEVWHVKLTPSTVNSLISDDFAVWDMEFEVLDDSANHASCPTHRIIDLS